MSNFNSPFAVRWRWSGEGGGGGGGGGGAREGNSKEMQEICVEIQDKKSKCGKY